MDSRAFVRKGRRFETRPRLTRNFLHRRLFAVLGMKLGSLGIPGRHATIDPQEIFLG